MWQSKIFGFATQLKIGDSGESAFMKCYPELKPRNAETRDYDIIIRKNESVELKSDTYPPKNLFIERYGNISTKADGSIWKCSKLDIDWFVYYFIKERLFLWFEPNKLMNFIDKNLFMFENRTIRNKTYSALGYIIPKEKIQKFIIREDKF
jgi:hypothetical protein